MEIMHEEPALLNDVIWKDACLQRQSYGSSRALQTIKIFSTSRVRSIGKVVCQTLSVCSFKKPFKGLLMSSDTETED